MVQRLRGLLEHLKTFQCLERMTHFSSGNMKTRQLFKSDSKSTHYKKFVAEFEKLGNPFMCRDDETELL